MKNIFLSLMLLCFASVLFADDPRILKLRDRKENALGRQALAKLLVKDKVVEAGPVFEEILKELKEDAKMRMVAAKSIGELGYKKALPSLMDIIKNLKDDLDVRQSCVEAMGIFADKQIFLDFGAGLVNFDDDSNRISLAYLEAVRKSNYSKDKDVLVMLSQFLGESLNVDVKKLAIAALAESKDKQTLTVLMISLQDKVPSVRREAIKAVIKIGGNGMVSLFISRLEDEKKDELREMYVDELLKQQIPKIKPIWIDELTKRMLDEKNKGIKTKMTKLLEKVKKAQANLEAGGTGQKSFTAPVNAVSAEDKAPAKK